ncbi:4773_t:CDS:2 [Paraglomus occultum]|uniref:4773_t:CDS:1 n=1 Tax=Paraglomus occultum TaxID=144539 RepID=A0A9N9G6L1_9GLOM|nr:4773_t:CDS:2 [Paraglomus occultum]
MTEMGQPKTDSTTTEADKGDQDNRPAIDEKPILRVIKKHTNWKNAITKSDLEDAFKHYDDVLFELYMYELNMMRFQRVHDMNVWERQRYELETQAMMDEIEEAKAEIAALESQLKVEELKKSRKEEYNILASEIKQHKRREETLNEIAELGKDILELETKEKELDDIYKSRLDKINQVLTVIANVQKEAGYDMDETPHEHTRRVSSSNVDEKKSSKRSESTNGHRKERAPQQWDGKGVPPLWAIAEASPDVLEGYVAAVRKRRRPNRIGDGH